MKMYLIILGFLLTLCSCSKKILPSAFVTPPKTEEEIEISNILKSLQTIGLAPISAYHLTDISGVTITGIFLSCPDKYLDKVRDMGYTKFEEKSNNLKSGHFNPTITGNLANMEWNQDTAITLEEKVKIFCTQNKLDGVFLLDIGTSGRSYWYTPIISAIGGLIGSLFREKVLKKTPTTEAKANKVALVNLELFDKTGKSLIKVQTRSYGTFIFKGYDVARSATRDAITEMGKAIDFVVK